MKVLITEAISDAGISLLRKEHEVDVRKVTPTELLQVVGDYDALITRSETRVTAEVLAAGLKLKVVGRAGVGVDNIDVDAATERGVVVVNVPGANTISTAEHAIGMLIALARHIPQAHGALAKESRWDRKTYVGTELYGKALGIIGLGRIGSEVAVRARALGMNLYAYDPYVSEARAEALGVTLCDMPELLEQVDFLTIHAAKTKESAHLLRAKELMQMKQGARIVNCARGGMVDEEALYEAIKSGHLGGAALDVFSVEPTTSSPLFSLPNVIVTPHLSASTVEAQEANGVYIADYVSRVLAGDLVAEAVNLPQVPRDASQTLVQHLLLAEALGSFLAQAFAGSPEVLEVVYSGDLAKHPTTLLTNTVLKGYLSRQIEESVNYINAPGLARRRGIEVRESKSLTHAPLAQQEIATAGVGSARLAAAAGQLSPQASVMTVRVSGTAGERLVSGMLRRDGGLRFISVNNLYFDAAPTRYMLVTRHNDKPGMIGRFGTVLGEAGINIAGLHLGRQSAGGEAVMVMQVDDPVTAEVVEKLAATPGIMEVRGVTLTVLPA